MAGNIELWIRIKQPVRRIKLAVVAGGSLWAQYSQFIGFCRISRESCPR